MSVIDIIGIVLFGVITLATSTYIGFKLGIAYTIKEFDKWRNIK